VTAKVNTSWPRLRNDDITSHRIASHTDVPYREESSYLLSQSEALVAQAPSSQANAMQA
jgi:hypothetical protein